MTLSEVFTGKNWKPKLAVATKDSEKIGSDIPSSESPALETEARKEQLLLFGDKQRQEEKKQVVHDAFIRFVQIAAYVMIGVFIVRMLHFVFPANWCWLTPEQISSLDKFLFSGALGGLVVGFIKQAFGTKEE